MPWDILFILCAALYAWLIFRGIMPLSSSGAIMDSDLMTYAQGMAGESHPEMFAADPVLKNMSAANSIHNIERALAGYLAPPNQWGYGLLIAGSIAIFIFYCAWYALGRWLYGSPCLAALLAIASGITIWVGWGTFWGVTHSDPLPRVFFGALMPLLLFLGLQALRHLPLRPLAMLCAGLFMWVHGVSALNCGAMLFTAFALIPTHGKSFGKHIFNLLICLAAFFTPVLIFLWPSLFQARQFSPAELALFQQVMDWRWHEDFLGFGKRLLEFISPQGQVFPVLAGGLVGWLVALIRGNGRERDFCRMCPCFVMALCLVAAFCWLESQYAAQFGRLPMGHELARGLRFLVPVSWICIVAGIGCVTGPRLRRVILACVMACLLLFTADRQYMAAQYAITELTGISLPLSDEAREEKAKAEAARSFWERVVEIVPQGEAIYSPEDAMQARYLALRPLAHSFKDGYAHFYNKDYENSKRWLELENLARESPNGWLKAWETSGAPWLVARTALIDDCGGDFHGRIALEVGSWSLAKRQ